MHFPSIRSTQAPLTFTFQSGDVVLSTITKTVGGITLTLSNSHPSPFYVDNTGIYIGMGASSYFDLTVTGGTIQFVSYEIGGGSAGATDTFAMLGGSGTSTGNPLGPTTGSYTANGAWTLAPGQTDGKLTANAMSGSTYSAIKSLTFSAI